MHGHSLESILILLGTVLLATGVGFGWFCYSKADVDEVEKASYLVSLSHSFAFTNIWIWGSVFGLITMVAGMFALFVGLLGMKRLDEMLLWYKTIFGSGTICGGPF